MNWTWEYLYRFPRHLRVRVCRVLLLAAGFGVGLSFGGNPLGGYLVAGSMATWTVIPEGKGPKDSGS